MVGMLALEGETRKEAIREDGKLRRAVCVLAERPFRARLPRRKRRAERTMGKQETVEWCAVFDQ
jgi:hypothetical protein